MNFLNNLKIGRRLIMGFGALLCLFIAAIVLGLAQMSRIEGQLERIGGDDHDRSIALGRLGDAVAMRAIAARNLALLTDAKAQEAELDRAKKAKAEIDTAFATLDKLVARLPAEASERQLLAKAHEMESRYEPIAAGVVQLATSQKQAEAIAKLTAECMPLLTQVLANLEGFDELDAATSAARIGEAKSVYGEARSLQIVIGLAALMAGLGMAWSLTRSITTPINEALVVARAVASGDLTTTISSARKDEAGQLLRALQTMNENLVKLVGAVRHSSESIATGSAQIAVGNQDLSQRTEEQASNLQETAASMDELSATVQNAADTARQASDLAHGASEVAKQGEAVVGQVIGTMEEISNSSRKIADINSVIDGIAFQTNILALNAAVEAARAGEQGRGFAVVAGEVRSLAQRSATAAREIKALIGTSVEKVENGSRLVGDAGRTMGNIMSQVQRVAEMIREISLSAQEQTGGISQVTTAVTQLDQVTQQNAALVEQSAAASESLKHQASSLVNAVSAFRLAHA
ncbi:methyl-accepting chemotaxis protein [Piscinibacter terrae]|uniref:HAMP domain-containing protein n=1 Tax=Piscinibacter terrae TaxID=2496871 RepID=A0A3N7HSL1_9BURK|nr:methyl-accepting chemotaxis protein [Albitalea terrae]RQP25277.1 HAMP domain-containing protein [Albitalea terrae]